MQASYAVKKEGKPCNLIELIKNDDVFAAVKDKLDDLLNPKDFIGRSPEQVVDFVNGEVRPIIDANREILGEHSVIEV